MLKTRNIIGDLGYMVPYKVEFLVALLQSQFTERELKLILNSVEYAKDEDLQGGLPGHNLLNVIAKLLNMCMIEKEVVEMALGEELQEEMFYAEPCCDCCEPVQLGFDFAEKKPEPEQIEVTLKVDTTELDDLIQRMNKVVEGYYGE